MFARAPLSHKLLSTLPGQPGLHWVGVGNTFRNNILRDHPHYAIMGGANQATCTSEAADPTTGRPGEMGPVHVRHMNVWAHCMYVVLPTFGSTLLCTARYALHATHCTAQAVYQVAVHTHSSDDCSGVVCMRFTIRDMHATVIYLYL